MLFGLEREGAASGCSWRWMIPRTWPLVDELSFQLNKPIRVHVAAEDDIDRALGLVRGRAVGLLAPEDEAGEPLVLESRERGSHAILGRRRWNSALLDWDVPQTAAGRRPPTTKRHHPHHPEVRFEAQAAGAPGSAAIR